MTIVRIIVVHMTIMRVIIMVVVMVVMRMIVPGVPVMGMPGMAVRVVMAFAQQPGTRQVHAQAERSDRHRLAEVNINRMQEPQHRFVADPKRNHGENDGAAERRQFAELAGAERKARIADVAAGEQIREPGDGQRQHVGGHMPAVGDERDRAEHSAADDFQDHHRGGQRHHAPGTPFALVVAGAEKGVLVGPMAQGM